MKVTILRPIVLKAKVTEGLKARMAAEMQEAIRGLDAEMEQIESQAKRATLMGQISPQQQMELRRLIEAEKSKRAERKQELVQDLKEIASLQLGSEIVQGQVQGTVEVTIGDDLGRLLAGTEIVVEDGKVIEIREG